MLGASWWFFTNSFELKYATVELGSFSQGIAVKNQNMSFEATTGREGFAWRIFPVSKWLVTPIYKPFRPFGKGTTQRRGLTNHGYNPLTNWDGPPSDHSSNVWSSQTSLNPKHSMGFSYIYRSICTEDLYGKLIVRQICQFHEECLEIVGAPFISC